MFDIRRRERKILVARFIGDSVSITGNDMGTVIKTLIVHTLEQVNYDTTLGNDKIVFYKRGTANITNRSMVEAV
ncbi:MAG: hypothetical protein HN342_14295 [Nitrospina sp.]|jgi:hypothetical protein|nr:hypothetical protein [Nitrospina sp.]